MICPDCSTPNEPGRKFCGECGVRLAVACPSCGTSNASGVRFCGECGTALDAGSGGASAGASAGPSAVAAARPSPARTAAGLPALGAAPVAERRLVTILFADLVGFTTIAEGRDHEEVRELLSRYFDSARELIERYGGTVEKFIGDAVMAVWGAPTAHEDDAERAVRAAIEVVDAVRGLAPGLEARAGVLTGEAAVTLGATNQGMVAGDLVNTASRLQSAAPPGVVLVGESTQRATASAIGYEPAGEQTLKGKEAPVAAYRAVRVIGERGGRGRGDRLEAGFVGRDSELRLLKDLYHATARERRVRLVSITGQGGVGKSRLAWELKKYADGVVEDVWWHEGRSPAYGEGITFWALGEMVRARAGLTETDDPATTRAKVAESVGRFVTEPAERERVERALLALLGAGEAPAGGAGELFGAWRTYFERMASTNLTVLLFEDLHWADPGLLDFIDHVLEWSRNVPILIITLARPELLERRSDWGAGRRNFLALDIEPLDEASMRQLLAGFVPDLPEQAVRAIVQRAEGIPLYAVETIRMLVAEGRLREREGGGYEPVGELGDLAIPETLHALIAARLDSLDPAERALVQDAAVLGQSFTPAGLAAVSGLEPAQLDARLRVLVRSDLLREEADPRSAERGQYAFVQALIREVAYSTLSLKDRRARHLAAARFFESLGDDELAGALAAHYLAAFRATTAGDESAALGAQARLALVGAADRAESLGAPRQAVTFLEQALEVAGSDAERATLLERAVELAIKGADLQRAARIVSQLKEVRAAMGDRSGMALAAALESETLYFARQRGEATKMAAEALREFSDLGDDPAVLRLTAAVATGAAFTRQHGQAQEMADHALAVAERLNMPELASRMLVIKSNVSLFQGRLWEAIALADGARRLADQHGLMEASIRANTALTNVLALDDPRATVETERQVVELARRLGRRDTLMVNLGNLAEDTRRTGEWDVMLRELEAAIAEDPDSTSGHVLDAAATLLRAYRGEVDEARAAEMFERLMALQDSDVASSADDLRAVLALNKRDFAGAAAAWLANSEHSDLNAPYALPKAGFAALLAGDAATANLTLDRLAALGSRGRAIETDIAAVRAGIAALEGDTADAIAGYRSARQRFQDLGLPWDVALTSVSAGMRLDPSNSEVAGWLAEARRTFETLRARPMVELVDEIVAGGAPAARATTSTVAAEPRTA